MIMFPILSSSLSTLDSDLLLKNSLTWPKQGYLTLISFAGFLTGYLMTLSYMSDPLLIGLTIIVHVESSSLWSLPNLVIQVLLENLVTDEENPLKFVENSKKLIEVYDKLEQKLRPYFMLLFISSQLISIFYIFNIIWIWNSKAFNYETSVISITLGLISMIIILISITNSVDEAEYRLRQMKKQIEKRLLASRDEEEKKQLEYCKNMADLLRPMNAAGYFDIDKTTLTSMLSVRLSIRKSIFLL